jgi:Coenzyme PQQ synthesis protein D (PqqD)
LTNHHYTVCTPNVISEIIDGEAVIMDMKSGRYFSADGAGALIWQYVICGLTHDQILKRATAFAHAPQAREEVSAFLDELQARGLIRESTVSLPAYPPPPAWSGTYCKPVLCCHEDMQDLIQMDPIHDVDDQVGWPTPHVDHSFKK